MPKVTLTDLEAGYGLKTSYNANNDAIEAAFENTLSRDGSTPNAMAAELDMNSNKIINVKDGVNPKDAANYGQLIGKAFSEIDVGDAPVVATIAAMQAILAPSNGDVAIVTEDGRAGTFVFDTSVTASGNGGTTFSADDATSGSWVRRFSGPVDVRWFGPTADGVADDRDKIQAAIDAVNAQGGGVLLFEGSKTYLVDSSTRPFLALKSGVTLDLNGSTLQRGAGDKEHPFIEASGGSVLTPITDIAIKNGLIRGTGANGDVSGQGAGILFFDVDRALVENIRTENTNADGILARRSENTVFRNVTIGNYGRNGISPTAGSFTYDNVRIVGDNFTGANPGLAFDAENDNVNESASHTIYFLEAKNMTFVDFWTAAAGDFKQSLHFLAGKIGPDFKPFNIRSTNATIADQFYIGPGVEIIAEGTSTSGVEIDNVSNITMVGPTIEKGTTTAVTRAIGTKNTVENLRLASVAMTGGWSFGFEVITGTLTDSVFSGSDFGKIRLIGLSTNNHFISGRGSFEIPDVATVDNYIGIGFVNTAMTTATEAAQIVNSIRRNTVLPLAEFSNPDATSSALRHAFIMLRNRRVPQGGSDFTGESGVLFGHDGAGIDRKGGYIKSKRTGLNTTAGTASSRIVIASANADVETEHLAVHPNGGIGVSSTTANTAIPSGATAYQLPIYDMNGNLLGYIPVYAAAWT